MGIRIYFTKGTLFSSLGLNKSLSLIKGVFVRWLIQNRS